MSSVYRGAVVDSIQRLFDNGTVVCLGERQLLDRFLSQGDESAFEAIVGRHGPMVLSICRHVLDDEQDVEDAFQATFLILVKRASSIRDRDVLGSWLYGVARRVAVRAQVEARRRRSRECTATEPLDVSAIHHDRAESNEVRAVVDAELERLPERYRAPLVLCDLEGQTHEQAAVELRCPVGTVKSRLSRGRDRLRLRLARRGFATPILPAAPLLATDPASAVTIKLLSQTVRAATQLATKGALTAGSITAQSSLLTEGVIHTMAMTKLKVAIVAFVVLGLTGAGALTAAGLIPASRAQGAGRADSKVDPREPVQPRSQSPPIDKAEAVHAGQVRQAQTKQPETPKRGALRIARLKHAGDWDIAPQAIPNLMESLRKPPWSLDVVVTQKDLQPRDPNLIYYPLLYLRGRAAFSLDEKDLAALRSYIDPGAGTLFADSPVGSPAFDASFRRLVKSLFPDHPLVPIPLEDELFTTSVGADLSKVELNQAAGGGRGYPQLEGVRINNYWAIIYSKVDIGGVLDANANIEAKGYTPESAQQIAGNVVIYSTLPGPPQKPANPPPPPEPGSERIVLDNGLTVLLRPVKGAKSIALTVLYSIGSDYDPAGRSGLTHMLEHLYITAAAGQVKARTADEFAGRYALGANAQTGQRYTVFAAVFPTNELDAELKDAAARMSDLRITPADLERERPRILEEVSNMFGGMPMLAALNNARELARPTPAGGREGGSPAHLRALKQEDIHAYWQRYYKPCNAILSLAGDIDSTKVRKAIETAFARIAPGEKPPTPLAAEKPKLGTQLEVKADAIEPNSASIACLAYAAPGPDSELYLPFLVLISRLWAGGSKLGNDGPTGSPVYFTPLDDGSIVAVSTEAKPGETSRQAYARIEAFVAETVDAKLRPFEINSARMQLATFLFSQHIPENLLSNNIYGVAFSLGRRLQLGIDPAKFDKALGALSDQDLRRAATEIFAPSRHTGAFVSVKN